MSNKNANCIAKKTILYLTENYRDSFY